MKRELARIEKENSMALFRKPYINTKSEAMVSICCEGQETKYRSGEGTTLELAFNERHRFILGLMLTQ